jgi:hypothetical protein
MSYDKSLIAHKLQRWDQYITDYHLPQWESIPDFGLYMEQTVLCEGKAYYGVGGQLCHYPKFDPDKYVILKLTPRRREGNWYRWNQEIPLNSPPELVQAAAEFSKLKIGYRGDLAFKDAEMIDVEAFLRGEIVCRRMQEPEQTTHMDEMTL